jgi:hypothetical protein
MNLTALNRLRWTFLLLSPFMSILLPVIIDANWKNNHLQTICAVIAAIAWGTSFILILSVFLFKRTTVGTGLKKFIILLIPFSFILIFVISIGLKNSDPNDYIIYAGTYTLIISFILTLILHQEKTEMILPGLIISLIAGVLLSRLSFSVIGQLTVALSFGFSSIGYFIMSFKSFKDIRKNKRPGTILGFCYTGLVILNALFFIIFASWPPVFYTINDTIGVIIFLLTCLGLLIMMPFSEFTEWSVTFKKSLIRLVLIPIILFLLIFSSRFLLPENTFRKIYSRDLSKKEIVHFNMQDYQPYFGKD